MLDWSLTFRQGFVSDQIVKVECGQKIWISRKYRVLTVIPLNASSVVKRGMVTVHPVKILSIQKLAINLVPQSNGVKFVKPKYLEILVATICSVHNANIDFATFVMGR